jgi:hypothetical protein
MITGLLKRFVLCNLSSPSGSQVVVSGGSEELALLVNTPIEFNRSNLRISLVASSPFMMGSCMSMSTKWKPPVRHFVTASRPFMAFCDRTLSLFMNASKSLRLMMLSSTIRTLIGGTAPLSIPVGNEGWSEFVFLFFLGRLCGRGDDIRGGGAATCC